MVGAEQEADRFEKEITKEVRNLIWKTADEVFAVSQRNLVENKWVIDSASGPITTIITDTGDLLKSGKVVKLPNGAQIQYNAYHASDVEFGTPPGNRAEFKQIKRWAERKLGVPRSRSVRAAELISDKIFNEGTDARPYLRSAVNKIVEKKSKERS